MTDDDAPGRHTAAVSLSPGSIPLLVFAVRDLQTVRLLPFLLGLSGISLMLGCGRSRSGRLTVANIIAVRPGMTMEQVTALLGEPISKESGGEREISCPGNAQIRCHEKCHFTFTYTQPSRVPWVHTVLWVRFTERKHVYEVFVKKYEKGADPGVYWAHGNPCDPRDPIVPLSADDPVHVRALGDLFEKE